MASSIYHAVAIDRFFEDLLAGQISGVAAGPALAMDAHALYKHWCDQHRVPAMASPAYFVQSLASRHGVPSLRKRYAMGDQVMGPHGVLYLATPPAPRNGFEFEWLGAHLSKFRASVATHIAVTRRDQEHA